MGHNEKESFQHLLDKLIATELSSFFVSVPVPTRPLLNNYPCLVFIESGEVACDIGKDGNIVTTLLPPHSVLFGLKGASTGCNTPITYDGSTLVVGFFDEYIRFVHYTFPYEASEPELFFYHTSEPLCSAGIMALEALRNISMNPDLQEAQFNLIKAILVLSRQKLQSSQSGKIGKAAMTWQKIEYYIEQHFMEESCSRKTIAKKFLLNESYLSSLCQLNTKRTLHDFIVRKKLAYSLLLLEQNMTIGEIAAQCGFNQTGYFIQVFRKTYGVSPGKYKENLWQNSKYNQKTSS